jgi:hypothetical protein
MNATYLVEIRLSCTKWRIRKITDQIARDFGIGGFLEPHPHVTLYGPFTLNDGVSSRDLLDAIGTVAARFDPVPFLIDGWERRDGMHGSVIAFPVRASESLCRLTDGIATALTLITTSQNAYDADPAKKWFHVTIANRLSPQVADDVYAHLTGQDRKRAEAPPAAARKPSLLERFLAGPSVPETGSSTGSARPTQEIPPPLLDESGIRITVMQDMAILGEFDLVEKRWVFGDHRHSAARWQKTLVQFRHHAGLEQRDPEPPPGRRDLCHRRPASRACQYHPVLFAPVQLRRQRGDGPRAHQELELHGLFKKPDLLSRRLPVRRGRRDC